VVKAFEAGEELAAGDSAQHRDGEKKARIARMHPTGVITTEASCRNDAVDVRMSKQVLAPGVENAEDADLCAQVLGVSRDFQQSSGAGGEQEMVKLSGIILRQEVKFVGDSADHVKVIRGQEFLFPSGEPALPCLGLALGAVPVATRIV
jgi:hypothetical protein